MSAKGIKLAAAIFERMQEDRQVLLSGDKQDILLGQMLDIGKDAMKDLFAKYTLMPKETRSYEWHRPKLVTRRRKR